MDRKINDPFMGLYALSVGDLRVYHMYEPLWSLLSKDASEKVRKGNYERLFDAARPKVRAWEAAHPVGAGG